MEKRTWAKLVVTVVVIAGICAGIYRQWYWQAGNHGSVAPWGVGDFRAAEKSYYANRINNILANWTITHRSNSRISRWFEARIRVSKLR
ncbi:MAG TPA: hypothetical protein VJJ98_09835 [Sedimentisphaerales bacterium]|nr:hypothetical protein [Sedimentisphaerales bacterium]